jgi:hypothetical protein
MCTWLETETDRMALGDFPPGELEALADDWPRVRIALAQANAPRDARSRNFSQGMQSTT